uniref:(+)-delta-cadinene synthase isozyme A n=1 Tax=Cajanus cajan TaxID=3821 RepID=A0A151UD65_CAJCA
MTEARWLNNNYKPTTNEYLHTSTISCCCSLMAVTSYIGMGDIATENIFKWFEQKRGHVSSFLECYMNQYDEFREAAIHECQKRITDSWKVINEECLMPTNVPMPFLKRIFNLTCFIDVFYKDKDNFTHSKVIMKTSIKALLIDPVPI